MKNINVTYDPEWREKYKSMTATPDEAVAKIRPGQRIFIGTGCAEPLQLVSALTKRAYELPDTEIIHLLTFGDAPYAHKEMTQFFRVNSFFIAKLVSAFAGPIPLISLSSSGDTFTNEAIPSSLTRDKIRSAK